MEKPTKPQLTSPRTCRRKHKYHSNATAERARKRRNNNKLKSFYFTASYKCNICDGWHLTTQVQDEPVG